MNVQAESIELPATDGFMLGATRFSPKRPNGACVIINSATAVRQTYYRAFAHFLAEHGFTTLTYDYRGIGRSLPSDVRTFEASMQDWGAKDFAGMLRAAGDLRLERVFLVGHSVGGQLIGLTPRSEGLTGVIAVGAQSGYWRLWPGVRRYALAALWHGVMPGLSSLLSYFPARALRMGEDLPAGVATQWARWCRSPSFLLDELGEPVRDSFARFERPILALSFDDDAMAPRPAVDALCAFFTSARIERRHVHPADLEAKRIGHFGFFRPHFEQTLWRDAVAWLQLRNRASVDAHLSTPAQQRNRS